MTLEEYEQIVSRALVAAYNNKNSARLMSTFREADDLLERSQIHPNDRKRFWEDVHKAVHSGQLLLEKQSNSALLALMQMLEKEIAARTGASK